MKTTIITMELKDQELLITSKPVIASGGINEVKIKFTFDDNWSGLTKTATFYKDIDTIYKFPIDYDECIVPNIVTTDPCILNVAVYGEDENDNVRTSSVARLQIVQGAKPDGVDPLEELKRQWTQEAVESFLVTVRGSMLANVGGDYDYTDGDIAYLVGTEPYTSGVLHEVANQLHELEETVTHTGNIDLVENIVSLDTSLNGIKAQIITVINLITSSSYSTDISWSDTMEHLNELPTEVSAKLSEMIVQIIESLKTDIVGAYAEVFSLTRQEQVALIAELDSLYPSPITNPTEIAEWGKPLYTKAHEKGIDDTTEEMNVAFVESINTAMNEDVLSADDVFSENLDVISTKVSNTIDTINATMYDETQDITYTEAIDRIEDVRKDLEITVNGNIGEPFPSLIDKARNASYMQSIIDAMETSTKLTLNEFNNVFNNSQMSVKLPYANTFNATSISSTYLGNIEEVGFDMTNIVISGNTNAFVNARENSIYTVTGLDRANISTLTKTRGLFLNCKFKELYSDRLSVPVNAANTDYSFNAMFSGCTKLKKIGKFNKLTRKVIKGEYAEIDFTGSLSTYQMFMNCYDLEEVRFVPNTLSLPLDLSYCSLLSKESALSVINSCATVSSATALKLSRTNPKIQDSDPDIAAAIASATAKGWSVSYA